MALSSLWTRGLKPLEKADAVQNLKNAQKELDLVRNLVYNVYVDSLSNSESDYSSPSWAFLKARKEGEQAAYEKLLKILDTAGEDRSLTKTKKRALTDDHRKS